MLKYMKIYIPYFPFLIHSDILDMKANVIFWFCLFFTPRKTGSENKQLRFSFLHLWTSFCEFSRIFGGLAETRQEAVAHRQENFTGD